MAPHRKRRREKKCIVKIRRKSNKVINIFVIRLTNVLGTSTAAVSVYTKKRMHDGYREKYMRPKSGEPKLLPNKQTRLQEYHGTGQPEVINEVQDRWDQGSPFVATRPVLERDFEGMGKGQALLSTL